MIGLLLKESDCDVDHREHHGWAALHEASRQGNRQVIQMLLKAKAHTNILTNLGETPIYIGQSHTSLGLHTSAKSFAQKFCPSIDYPPERCGNSCFSVVLFPSKFDLSHGYKCLLETHYLINESWVFGIENPDSSTYDASFISNSGPQN